MIFKKDDWIKCVNTGLNDLTIGKVYRVLNNNNNSSTHFVKIKDDEGAIIQMFSNRFILDIKKLRSEKLKQLNIN